MFHTYPTPQILMVSKDTFLLISHAGNIQVTCGHKTQYLSITNSSTIHAPCGCKVHSKSLSLPVSACIEEPISTSIVKHTVSFPMLKLANLSHMMSNQLNQMASEHPVIPHLPNLENFINKVSTLSQLDKRDGIHLTELLKQKPIVYSNNFEPIKFDQDNSWTTSGCLIAISVYCVLLSISVFKLFLRYRALSALMASKLLPTASAFRIYTSTVMPTNPTQLSFDNKIDLTQTIMLVIVGIPLLLVLIYKIQACIRTLFVRYRQQLSSKLPYIITPPLLRQKSHLYLKICDDKQMTILYFLDIPFEFSTTTFSQLPQIRSITTNPGLIKPSINISWTSTQNALVVAERACQINIALPDKIPCTNGQLNIITSILEQGRQHIDNKFSYSILALDKRTNNYEVLTTRDHYPLLSPSPSCSPDKDHEEHCLLGTTEAQ